MSKIFVPGLLAMIVPMMGDRLLYQAHITQRVYWFGPAMNGQARPFVLVDPALLPLFAIGGAMAAWSSMKASGNMKERLLAAEFPMAVLTGMLAIVFAIDVIGRAMVGRTQVDPRWAMYAFVGYFVGWVLLPATALFIGAVPMLRTHEDYAEESE